jgi:hypothetical protein
VISFLLAALILGAACVAGLLALAFFALCALTGAGEGGGEADSEQS